MSRGRAQSASMLAVLLAVLLVLSVSAVVAPGIGTGAEGEGLETPAPLGTPTVTESEIDEGDDNTTAPVPGDPSAVTSFSVDEDHNNTIAGDLAAHRTTLRGVQNLVNTTEPEQDEQSANLTSAVRLVRTGMKLQVAQGRQSDQPTDPADVALLTTASPTHDSPSAAAFALLNRYNVTPTAKQAANIRALDDIPDPTRSELTDVLDAYLGYAIASQTAYADVNRTRLRTMKDYAGVQVSGNDAVAISKNEAFLGSPDAAAQSAENTSGPTASAGGLQAAGVEDARVRAAQIRLLEATVDLNTALEQKNAPGITTPASHPVNPFGVQVSPVLSINLSTHNNIYQENYAFQVDSAGNDTYNNNAGGPISDVSEPPVAALVDLNGDDEYNGRNGGAAGLGGTSGFLLDAGGNDIYDAGYGAGTNGGGAAALGFLLDVDGDDSYRAGREGTNGGGYFGGRGFLLDRSGSDTYNATDVATNGGGAVGGVGTLVDISGRDTYMAGSGGTNGGGDLGVGVLVDAGGDDYYINKSGGHGDDFRVNKKGTVGVHVDLQATNTIPDTGPPSTPSTTSGFTADLCVEGVRNSCDGDENVGQAENNDNDTVYGTIQAAVDAASTNQTLEVKPDTYHETVSVTTPNLTLVANHSAAPGDVVLDGGAGTGDPREDLSTGVKVQAAAVNLTGFVLQNYASDEIVLSAGANQSLVRETTVHGSIAVTDANGTAIRANRIDQNNSGAAGLTVATAPDATVANNTVTGGGIILTASPTPTVVDNTVKDVSRGEDSSPVGETGIAGTHSTTAADSHHSVAEAGPIGISVTGGRDVTVANNTVGSLSEAGPQDGPVGISVVETTAPIVSSNSVTDLTESGAGAGPVGITVADASATTLTYNSFDILNEAGAGVGPVGIRFAASTLAVPIVHNEVTNTQAGGDGRGPVGLLIADSDLDSSMQPFGTNAFEDGGGLRIANSTVSPVTDTTFAEDIMVVANSTVAPVTENTFTGNVAIVNSTVTPVNNTFYAAFHIQNSAGLTVANNTFSGVSAHLQHTTNITVVNNTFSGTTGALKLSGSTGSTVVYNTVVALNETAQGRPVGFAVTNGTGTTIAYNALVNLSDADTTDGQHDGPVGIQVNEGTNTTIAHNTLRGFTAVAGGTGPVGIIVANGSDNTVAYNELGGFSEDGWGPAPIGITVMDGRGTIVTSNTIENFNELGADPGPVGISVNNETLTSVTNNSLAHLKGRHEGGGPVGVRVRAGRQTTVAHNVITGLSLHGEGTPSVGIKLADSVTTTVTHNRMRGLQDDARGVGIRLAGTANSHVQRNTFMGVNNSVVINSSTPSALALTHNRFAGNGTFGVVNNGSGVINATHNYWGAPTGPSSPSPEDPLSDPKTSLVANGDGAAVSEGPTEGVANVHFDPWLGAPTRGIHKGVEGTCDTINPDGNTGEAENTDGDSVYGTIQAAVDAASPGTTISVAECSYQETVTIETPDIEFNIFGDVLLTGEDTRATGITVRAANVTITGFQIHNYTGAGIAVVGPATGTRIHNVTVTESDTGVGLRSTDATLSNSTLRENGNGTVITGKGSPRLVGNWYHNNTHAGLYVAANATVPHITVYHNRFHGNGAYGVENADETAVLNATHNHWGSFTAPSSPNGSATLEDPETGRPANGSGDAVSAGATPGEANVHFDPYNVVHYRWDIDYFVDSQKGTDCEIVDYTSIDAAENASSSGDTIVVCAGTYDEFVHVTTNHLTIRGSRYFQAAGKKPSLNGSLKLQELSSDGATIRGLHITSGSWSHPDGIELFANNAKIIGNNLSGNRRAGISRPDIAREYNTSGTRILNNTLTNNEYGYACFGGKDCGDTYRSPVLRYNIINNNSRYGLFHHHSIFLRAKKNIWACGGPSGGHRDPRTGRRANGTGDRIVSRTYFDPFYELDKIGQFRGPQDPRHATRDSQLGRVECTSAQMLQEINRTNNSAPTVDHLSVSEVETDNPDAAFDVDWTVNDSDGNLDNVTVRLRDDTAGGATDDEETHPDLQGESASGRTRVMAPDDDGSGHNYTVRLTVYDEKGEKASATTTIQETEPSKPKSGWPTTTATPTGSGGDGTGPGSGNGTGSGTGGSGGATGTSTAGGSGGESTVEATADDEPERTVESTAQTTVTRTVTPPPASPPPATPSETDTETPPEPPTPEVIPGFGVGTWLVGAVLLAGLVALRRRD